LTPCHVLLFIHLRLASSNTGHIDSAVRLFYNLVRYISLVGILNRATWLLSSKRRPLHKHAKIVDSLIVDERNSRKRAWEYSSIQTEIQNSSRMFDSWTLTPARQGPLGGLVTYTSRIAQLISRIDGFTSTWGYARYLHLDLHKCLRL
jgi:hypothetical protein